MPGRHQSKIRVTALCGLAALLLAFSSCKSPRRTEPIVGPIHYNDSSQLALGRKAYDRHCHSCHPDGDGGLGPSLNDKPLPGSLIAFQVRHGLGVMPSFDSRHLPGKELDAIVAYLKNLRQQHRSGR